MTERCSSCGDTGPGACGCGGAGIGSAERLTDLLLGPTGNPTQYEVIADGQIVGRLALFSALRDHRKRGSDRLTPPSVPAVSGCLASKRRGKPTCRRSPEAGSKRFERAAEQGGHLGRLAANRPRRPHDSGIAPSKLARMRSPAGCRAATPQARARVIRPAHQPARRASNFFDDIALSDSSTKKPRQSGGSSHLKQQGQAAFHFLPCAGRAGPTCQVQRRKAGERLEAALG